MNLGYLTPKQVAAYLGVTDRTVRNLISDGSLLAISVGRSWRVRRDWLDEYKAQREATSEPDAPVPRDSVYFVRGERLKLIKIGHAGDVLQRMRDLQVGSPDHLELVGTADPAVYPERALHERFADLRTHGEWHRQRPPLVRFIVEHSTYRGLGYRRLALEAPP